MTTTAAAPTRLDAILLEPGLACLITDYLPYNAPQLGMLVQLNTTFQRAFKDTAAEAKQDVENDARFVALCQLIVHDLLAHLDFEKVDDDVDEPPCHNQDVSEYSAMFMHADNGTIVCVIRGDDSCGYSVRVSIADGDYLVKDLRTAEEWHEFAMRLEYPPRASLSSSPSSSSDDDDHDEEEEDAA